MARNSLMNGPRSWKSFLSLVLVAAQVGIGMPVNALASGSIGSARASGVKRSEDGMLSRAKVLTAALQVRIRASASAAVSALNPPTEFSRLALQFEEPLVRTGPTSHKEDQALLQAMLAYQKRTEPDDFRVLQDFLSEHPSSGWRVALLTNLGLAYYHYGYFSKAISAWQQAWETGRSLTEQGPKAMVDRAIGELIRMHARIGHADRLAELLKEVETHPVSGPATEAVDGAKEGLWMMRNEPGVAYLCGPMALRSLLMSEHAPAKNIRFLGNVRSGPQGFTLAQVASLAQQAMVPYQIVFRAENQPVPVPSVVHWKVSHFAAILSEENGRFHIKDPTFGTDLWVSRGAIDSEASGYFLIPGEEPVSKWRKVSTREAGKVRGMGYTASNEASATTSQDDTTSDDNSQTDTLNEHNNANDSTTGDGSSCGATQPSHGMCGASVTEMVVSVKLTDTPVGYRPAIGPSMFTTLTYNQREAGQPATFGWFNASPKWTLNWLSYIEDDPTLPGSGVTRYPGGGGSIAYSGYNSATNTFVPETRNAAVLTRTVAGPITYRRLRTNGGVEIFSQSNGATSFPRRVFLTQVVDPAGNSLTFNYDNQMRLTSITDATGRSTTFSYGVSGKPLLISAITDPFGRSALLAYDASGRLSQITDVLGLTSQFYYDASGLINFLLTPYGGNSFFYGDNGNTRYAYIEDPYGKFQLVMYAQGIASIPFYDFAVPVGIQYPFYSDQNNRDTYIWDKHAYAVAGTDFTKARIKHWTHLESNFNFTADTIESIKNPLESKIWYNYPGQFNATYPYLGTAGSGTLDKRTNVARILDNGTTQLAQYQYNAAGKTTSIIDPRGRHITFQYAANLIDLTSVQQNTALGFVTVAQFTYNSQHLPLSYTDAAGQTTSYVYDSAGHATQITDPLGHATRYVYDSFGRLTQVINANGQTAATFTYDPYDRVATRTDSEGYTVSFAYDVFDRLIQEGFPDGTTRQYTYNKLDLASVTDRQGRVTTYTYDAVRRLVDITDPLSRHTKFGYYENDKLKTLTDANNNTTTWNIDLENRITSKVYADGKQFTNTYEATTSRLKAVTDPLNQVKQYAYTLDDQVASLTYLNALNPTPNVTFTYDAYFRRLTSMTDASGTTQYQYEPLGALGALRMLKEVGPYQNDAYAYQYDALGRVVGRTVDTSSETFSYDNLGRPISHGGPLGSFSLAYLGQTEQPISRSTDGGPVRTGWEYDSNTNDRRLTQIKNGAQPRNYHLTTTSENLITGVDETGGGMPQSWNYTYDAADRLLQASSRGNQYAYSYDPADNITSVQAPTGNENGTFNNVNQVAAFNGQPFIYDANGNVTDDGVRTYRWDAENRLSNVTYKNQPTRKTTFRYDGFGRRIAIIPSNGPSSIETRYLWCGITLCQARDSNDVVSKRYYTEGELSAGSPLYYAQDQLGSVRDVLGGATGQTAASFDYDPFGNPTRSAGAVSTDFRYAQMFYEENSGLYLTEYRAYDPQTGRWLSRDPIAEIGGNNLYSYVNGRSTSYVDPSGLDGMFLSEQMGGPPNAGTAIANRQFSDELAARWDVVKTAFLTWSGISVAAPLAAAAPEAIMTVQLKCFSNLQSCQDLGTTLLEKGMSETSGQPPSSEIGLYSLLADKAAEALKDINPVPFGTGGHGSRASCELR